MIMMEWPTMNKIYELSPIEGTTTIALPAKTKVNQEYTVVAPNGWEMKKIEVIEDNITSITFKFRGIKEND